MFPFVYGFTWSVGNIIFLGTFFAVVAVIGTTFILSMLRSAEHLTPQTIDELRWHAGFEELPASARACRHAMTGEAHGRICPNAFNCTACRDHGRFQEIRRERSMTEEAGWNTLGFQMPEDRMYHRGHTWVRPEADGTVTVGMDDFGRRLLGRTGGSKMPRVGQRLHRNGTAWTVRKGTSEVAVLAPLNGTVVEIGHPGVEWAVRVRPDAGERMEPLLRGAEIRPWLQREFERFQRVLAPETSVVTMADGGVPVEDLSAVIPKQDQPRVYEEMFLQP